MELFNEYPFNKLPKELIYIILSYTPQPQSKELTNDIRNYYESKKILLQSYHNYYVMKKEHLWSWKGKINSRQRPKWFVDMVEPLTHGHNFANI